MFCKRKNSSEYRGTSQAPREESPVRSLKTDVGTQAHPPSISILWHLVFFSPWGDSLCLFTIPYYLKMSSPSMGSRLLPTNYHLCLLVQISKRNLIGCWLANGLPPWVTCSCPPPSTTRVALVTHGIWAAPFQGCEWKLSVQEDYQQ